MNAELSKETALSSEEFQEWLKASGNINQNGKYNPERVVETWSQEGRRFEDLPDHMVKAFNEYMCWENSTLPFIEEDEQKEYW